MAARGGFVSSFHNLARRLGGGGGKQVSACSLLAWNVRLMVYRAIAVALDDEIRFLGTHHHHAPRPWGVWWIVKRSLGERWAPTMMMLNSNMKPVKIHICSHLKSPLQLVLQNLRFNYTRAEKMDWKQEKYFFFRENFLEREGTMIRCRVGHSRAALKNAIHVSDKRWWILRQALFWCSSPNQKRRTFKSKYESLSWLVGPKVRDAPMGKVGQSICALPK